MEKELRILILEDMEEDAGLIDRALKKKMSSLPDFASTQGKNLQQPSGHSIPM